MNGQWHLGWREQPREHCWLPEESCMVKLTILLKKFMCQLTSKSLDLFLRSDRCEYYVNIIGGCVGRDVIQIFFVEEL